MSNKQFIDIFQSQLQVASPKREEIVAEVTSHLTEDTNLGDPKHQARDFNHVYFGKFGTFEWLLARAAILPFIDLVLQDILTHQIIKHGRTGWEYGLLTISFSIHLLTLANVLVSAHTIAHMHRRWLKAGWWGIVVVLTSIGLILYTQVRLFGALFPSDGWQNFFWNIGYVSLNSLIFIPVFFITWPTTAASWLKKILTFIGVCLVTYILWAVVNDLFSGLFTWLYTYPWVLKSLPNGLRGWDTGIILAITGVFFLYEIRFTQRLYRRHS